MTNRSRVAKRVLNDAAINSEIIISYGRLVVISLMLIRFISLGPSNLELIITVIATSVSVIFSLAYLAYYNRRKSSKHWIWSSTIVDVITAFLIILNNPLFPDTGYRGVLHIPDTFVIPILIFVSGFRLSVSTALFSGVANAISLIVIIYLEGHYLRIVDYSWAMIIMWLIIIVATTLAAVISAFRTTKLCDLAAIESMKLEQTKEGIKSLLQSHHDAHSILTSININTEKLIELANQPSAEFTKTTRHLKSDLSLINSCIEQIKHTSDAEIKLSSEAKVIDLNKAITGLVNRLNSPKTANKISFSPAHQNLYSSIKGGENTIDRILINLINNAFEGTKFGKAEHVSVSTEICSQDFLKIVVSDDGPGFIYEPDDSKLTKLGNFGVGLSSVEDLVSRNNGTVDYEKREQQGASVTIRLHRIS